MPRYRFGILIGLLLNLPSSPAAPGATDTKTLPAPNALALARLDAARRTYGQHARNLREGWVLTGELVYRWSRRWLEAEQALCKRPEDRIAACQAHVERMR